MMHRGEGAFEGGTKRMDTIDAVSLMAAANDAGLDQSRTPAAGDLNRRAPGLAAVTARLIETAEANGLQPAIDGATQVRIASAIERVAARAVNHPIDPLQGTRAAHLDFMLQEAAAARMPQKGGIDPLAPMVDVQSSRTTLRAAHVLKERHGVDAHAIFDRADLRDMQAIASGRFADIRGEITSFAISKHLSLDPGSMAATIVGSPSRIDMNAYPGKGAAKGPVHQIMRPFGTKGAER